MSRAWRSATTPMKKDATAAAIMASPNHNKILKNRLRITLVWRLILRINVAHAAHGLDPLNAINFVAQLLA